MTVIMSLLLSLLPLLLRHYDPPVAPEFQDPFLKAFYLILGMWRSILCVKMGFCVLKKLH